MIGQGRDISMFNDKDNSIVIPEEISFSRI